MMNRKRKIVRGREEREREEDLHAESAWTVHHEDDRQTLLDDEKTIERSEKFGTIQMEIDEHEREKREGQMIQQDSENGCSVFVIGLVAALIHFHRRHTDNTKGDDAIGPTCEDLSSQDVASHLEVTM